MDEIKTNTKAGDPAQWVDEHGDALFRFALLRVRDQATAEDMVQETFLAAVKAKQDFAGDSQLRTWLIGILRHKIADHFRKHGRTGLMSDLTDTDDGKGDSSDMVIDQWFDKSGHWRNAPKNWEVNPEEIAQRQEFWKVLQHCMENLPGKSAEAFALRVMEDTDPAEVCKALGITSTNLWVLLHRARARLRACLETNWFGKSAVEPK